MSFIDTIRANARETPMRLVLPEGTEPRTLQAARKILDGGLADSVTLVGCPEEIERAACSARCDLGGMNLVFPECCEQRESFAAELYRLRRHRGLTVEQAWTQICDPLGFGAMLVRRDEADTLVAGAASPTAQVLKAVFTIIGPHPDVELASSFFIMHLPGSDWGEDGHLLFSDCATIPNPDSRQLSEIALAAAESFRVLLRAEPRVAMLSFSTFGSASNEMVDKVAEATAMAKMKRPDLLIDGEMQLDAALVPEVAEKKAPASPVAGRANVLIFPDLNSGNIGYKLVQRLAGAEAYGPFLQGLAKPVSDLSRGCSVEDIVNTAAVALVQAARREQAVRRIPSPMVLTAGVSHN
jgi:phosphate acetyltransferase